MNLKEKLENKKCKFVSIYDIINEIAESEKLSIAEASSLLLDILDDSPAEEYYKHRDEINMLKYASTCFLYIEEDLNNLITTNTDTLNSPDFLEEQKTLMNYGFYKDDIISIFKEQEIDLLKCFDKNHFSLPKINSTPLQEKSFTATPNQPAQDTEYAPHWKYYGSMPALSTNECACLLNNIEPERYNQPIYDEQGDFENEFNNDIPDDIVKKIDATFKLLFRNSENRYPNNNLLKPIKNNTHWINEAYQYEYETLDFIEWAERNGYELSPDFIEQAKTVHKSKAQLIHNHDEASNNIKVIDNIIASYEKHPLHSGLLLAALKAWQYSIIKLSDTSTLETPKTTITNYLEKNIDNFFGEKKKSKPNISNIATVANWRHSNKAFEKTEKKEHLNKLSNYENNLTKNIFDDDIPF